MAYIHSFKIEGLAGHDRPVERALDRHVNVFWGLNGSGKTSLLRILHAALQNETTGLSKVPFESAEVIFWSVENELHIRRTYVRREEREVIMDEDGDEWERVGDGPWEMVLHPNAWRSEAVFLESSELLVREVATPAALNIEHPYRHAYLPISRLSELRGPRARPTGAPTVVDDEFLDQQFAEHVRARWQRYNSTALAEIRAIQQQGLASILAILFGRRVEGPAKDSLAESLVGREVTGAQAYTLVRGFLIEQGINLGVSRSEFIETYDRETSLREVVTSIQATSGRVQHALKPQQEFSAVIERLYSGGKTLVLESSPGTRGGLSVEVEEKRIPLQSLSSGEKQLLRLMLEVLAAEQDTVMIDEPELSMHVDWQLELIAAMRRVNPSCQLLLATHSPEVMANVTDDLVFQL